jgi:hypothetical protein
VKRLLITAAIAVLAIGLVPPVAFAEAPRDQGWWSATSVAVPGTPVALPAPPDVPSNGLLVQGGLGGPPTAYAALVYELDQGVGAQTLTLPVAPNSLTTPSAPLQLCQLLQPINHPEQGGPMTDAPPYNCGKQVTAAPTSDGKSYQFDVAAMMTDQVLAVAILPTGPADRIVLSAPDSNSLATQSAPAGAGSSTDSGIASDAIPALPSDAVAASPLSVGSTSADVPALTAGPSVATPPPAARSSDAGGAFVPAVSARPAKATPLLVVLLVLGALGGAALWIYAGRQRSDAAVSGPSPG